MTKILIIIHTIHGHIFKMAKAIEEGIKEVEDVEVVIKRVPESISDELLEKIGALAFQKTLVDIPIASPEELENFDAIIFGTGTRFGNMTGQMRNFMDQTGGLWMKGGLVGKPASVFTSSATQHGGQETTITSFHTTLLHHGMIIVGLPYSFQGQMTTEEISGGSPYGASTITGGDGSRMPSENELAGARFQGKHIAKITKKLFN